MNRLINRLMVVLLAAFMFLGVVTTPVQAEDVLPDDWFTFEEEEEAAPQGTMAEAVAAPVYASGTLEAESKNYKVSVTFNESAEILEGTSVTVTELEEGSEAYNDAKAAVAAEKGEDAVEGFAAFDISLYYGDEIVEPADTVTVSVEAKNIPAGAENLEIQHITEAEDNMVAELVASESDETEGTIELNDTQAVAEFDVDSFSTFTLTWTSGGSDKSATIQWGEIVGGEFVEMESEETVFLDTSASTISIDNAYEGYYSLGAAYYATPAGNGVDIEMTLYKTANGWQYNQIIVDPGTGEVTHEKHDIADGSLIRVYYYQPSSSQVHPSGAGDTAVPTPTTKKEVIDNGDGTYKIQLTIEGANVQEDHSHYANVLIILDRTYSMSYAMGNSNRWAAAKSALLTLIDTLTTGDNAGNAGKIDFALADFGQWNHYGVLQGTWDSTWTKNNTAFRSYISSNNFSYLGQNTGGWGTNWEGGMTAGKTAMNAKPDNDPTFVIFITDGDPNARNNYNSNRVDADVAASYAYDEVRDITGTGAYLYGVFAGADQNSASYRRLDALIRGQGQGGVKTIAANDPDTIRNEFAGIAQTILDTMGPSNVSTDDGIPELATVNAAVAGEANGFVYEISTDGTNFSTWNEAPGASYSQANGVTWDLSEKGTLMSGTQYRVSFDVWPSQAAYDLIADLNNGIKDFDTDLTEEEQSWITGSKETGYTMKTNTHLNTSYSYNGVDYTDAVQYQIEDMDLPTETVSVKKIWNNELDQREGQPVQLIVTKDKETYLSGEQTVVKAPDWRIDDIYISMGQITIHNGEAKVIEPGHDYTIIEPESLEYYWELTADVYHPMVINGVPTNLLLDKEATSADNENTFEINGKFYTKGTGENLITATNDRRSYLNITKAVTGTGAPEDAKFEFTFKIDNPNGTHPADGDDYDANNDDFWFSITESSTSTTPLPDMEVTGATAEAGNTGYWHAQNGTTVTVKMKVGWNLRVINLRSGTEYEIEESETMDPGFVFDKAEATADGADDATAATITGRKAVGTIDFANTDYTVTYTNKYLGFFYVYHSSDLEVEKIYMTDSRVVAGKFDVFSLTKDGTLYGGYYKDYAGKSTGYESAKLTYDENNKSSDKDGTAYSYDYIDAQSRQIWQKADAYTTEKGTSMTPEQDETYFLKEVPKAYILPYTHYTYNKSDKLLRNMWYISALDDLQYDAAGFFVETYDAKGNKTATVVDTLTVTATSGGSTVKLTPSTLFGKKDKDKDNNVIGVKAGYLTYWDSSALLKADTTSVYTPYWLTPDGIYVCGLQTRTISFNNGKVGSGGMRIADADTAAANRFPVIE